MGKLVRIALGLSLLSLLLALIAVDAGGNPCAANPCAVKNPCAANPCAAKASIPAVAVKEGQVSPGDSMLMEAQKIAGKF